MDKLLEQFSKSLPAHVGTAITLAGILFFSIYYGKGYRTYTDAARDRMFLTILVVLIASAVIYEIQRDSPPQTKPLLVVPSFENDELDQYGIALSAEVEAALGTIYPNAVVHRHKAVIPDIESARAVAAKYDAPAVLYRAEIVRQKDATYGCFRLHLNKPDRDKTYSMVVTPSPKELLNDIAISIIGVQSQTPGAPLNPVLSRLDTLEREVARLRAQSEAPVVGLSSESAPVKYAHMRALLVGIDKYDNLPNLGYAVSDAKGLESILKDYGFSTTSLLDAAATRIGILNAVQKLGIDADESDLEIIYFSGHAISGTRPGDSNGASTKLVPYDFSSEESGIDVTELIVALHGTKARHVLVVLDSSYGVQGVDVARVKNALGGEGRVVQIYSGSQAGEYSVEDTALGGGVFTQSLIRALRQAMQANRPFGMHELASIVGTTMSRLPNGVRQTPQLRTIGSEEIVWGASRSGIQPP